MANLARDVGRCGHGVGNLLAQQVTRALAQTPNRRLHGAFRQVQPCRHVGVRRIRLLAGLEVPALRAAAFAEFRRDYSGQLTGSVTLTGFGTCGTWC